MLNRIVLDGNLTQEESIIGLANEFKMIVSGWLSKENYLSLKKYNNKKDVFFRLGPKDDKNSVIESNIRESDGILYFFQDESSNEKILLQNLTRTHKKHLKWINISIAPIEAIYEICKWISLCDIDFLYVCISVDDVLNSDDYQRICSMLKGIFRRSVDWGNTPPEQNFDKFNGQGKDLIFRINYILILLIICIFGLGYKAFSVQVLNHENMVKLSEQDKVIKMSLKSRRAGIVDRNGLSLSSSIDAAWFTADPSQIKSPERCAKILSKYFNLDSISLEKKLSSDKRFISIKRGVSMEVAQEFIANHRLSGVYYKKDFIRLYPFDYTLSPLIGFVGTSGGGLEGLEFFRNSYLASDNKTVQVLRSGTGKILRSTSNIADYIDNSPDIVLSIDACLNRIIDITILKAIAESSYYKIFAILLNVESNEIVSLSCLPSVNSNKFRNFTNDYWENKYFTQLFYPGPVVDSLLHNSEIELCNNFVKFSLTNSGLRVFTGLTTNSHNNEDNQGEDLYNQIDILSNKLESSFGKKFKKIELYQNTGLLPQSFVLNMLLDKREKAIGNLIVCNPIQLTSFYANSIYGGKIDPTYYLSTKINKIEKLSNKTITKDDLIYIQSPTSISLSALFNSKYRSGINKIESEWIDIVIGSFNLLDNPPLIFCIGGLSSERNQNYGQIVLTWESIMESIQKYSKTMGPQIKRQIRIDNGKIEQILIKLESLKGKNTKNG